MGKGVFGGAELRVRCWAWDGATLLHSLQVARVESMSFEMPGQKMRPSAYFHMEEVPPWAACSSCRALGRRAVGITTRSPVRTSPCLVYMDSFSDQNRDVAGSVFAQAGKSCSTAVFRRW